MPAVHLVAVPLDAPARRVVAFGTNSAALWGWANGDPPVIREGTQVFMFPTVSRAALAEGSPAAALMRSGAHTARRAGRFRRVLDATAEGAHPDAGTRPETTVAGSDEVGPDSAWTMFWEVDDVVECRVRLDAFRTHDRERKFAPSFKMHGPTLARVAR